MSSILEDPRLRAAVAHETAKDRMVSEVAELLLSTKTWRDMTASERKVCIRHIVLQVESETELRDRINTELGIGPFAINWHLSDPGDKVGDEARALLKAFGGLVAKNGALVQIMTVDDMF